MRRRLLVLAIAVTSWGFVADVVYVNWLFAVRLLDHTKGHDVESYFVDMFYPGMPDVARAVIAAPGTVWSMPRAQNPDVYQRLVEMVYPRRLEPFDAARARAGDLVVLAAGVAIEPPHQAEEVLARPLARIVRIR